jgi:DNA sulfur modification protein DndD
MSTISAGMKQLSATALLWALKDISGREIPIIIDTPMGRIDAKHQENLLKKYYPKVGKQVILLPTDSELDERKYKLLQPHICKLYKLENSTGYATRIIESTEY